MYWWMLKSLSEIKRGLDLYSLPTYLVQIFLRLLFQFLTANVTSPVTELEELCRRSLQFSSVVQSCLTLCNPMDGLQHARPHCPSPHLRVYQTHVHWVSDAIPPSHPLLSPSPPAFNISQHQDLLLWVSSSHQVAKVLERQFQHQSFQWIFRTDFLEDWLVWSPFSPRGSQESSTKPQFKSINSSALSFLLWSNSHIHIWPLEKP